MSTVVLDEFEKLGLIPALIVTTPDKPQGRKLVLTPNVVKTWALAHQIPVISPAKLDAAAIEEIRKVPADVFIVASYGKIMPESLIEIPRGKTLNIHPSLLPTYRGASPLQSAMLNDDKKTGVSIMRIDKEMDHGPIVGQKEITMNEWPTYDDFEEFMAREGARLTASVLPGWLAGTITAEEQNHAVATYTTKFKKEDALIDLTGDAYANFRKIQAFHTRPQAYFMISKNGAPLRIKVTAASFKNDKLTLEKVIPEGGKEMSYADFQSGYLARS